MDKKQKGSSTDQAGGITDKKEINAGSGAFNQGSEQDPDYNDGTKVSDEEKETGHTPSNLGKEKEDPKDGNIGKNNAGGYE
ncbi:MAG: hypothetical protein H7Y01_09995 [Ferruginibacter sp.]|nr:hypothetical protein [Chitinophagaceae bacterium]